MTWVRLDDGFDDNAHILALSHQEFRLYVCALPFCYRNKTGGHLTVAQAEGLARKIRVPVKTIQGLIRAGRWHEAGDEYRIHDFDEYTREGGQAISAHKWLYDKAHTAERVYRYKCRQEGYELPRMDYRAVLDRDGLVCQICQGEVQPEAIHFDHIIPIRQGGKHELANVRVTHPSCNLGRARLGPGGVTRLDNGPVTLTPVPEPEPGPVTEGKTLSVGSPFGKPLVSADNGNCQLPEPAAYGIPETSMHLNGPTPIAGILGTLHRQPEPRKEAI